MDYSIIYIISGIITGFYIHLGTDVVDISKDNHPGILITGMIFITLCPLLNTFVALCFIYWTFKDMD